MARLNALNILGTLFLLLCASPSSVIVIAQNATLRITSDHNSSEVAVAAMISAAFGEMSNNLKTMAGPQTNGTATDGTTLPPNIANILRVMNGTNTTVGAQVTNALQQALRQQQAAGDLTALENAAKVVSGYLNAPAALGSGGNIQAFVQSIAAINDVVDSVSSLLSADTLKAVQYNLLEAKELAVTFLYAFPIAQLLVATALLALAAGIVGLIASIFFIVSSALLLAATIYGTTLRASITPSNPILTQSGYANVLKSSNNITQWAYRFAYSDTSNELLRVTSDLMSGIDSSLAVIETASNQNSTLGAFSTVGSAIPTPFADYASAAISGISFPGLPNISFPAFSGST